MVIFHSYVESPEGIPIQWLFWRYRGIHRFQTEPYGGDVFMTLIHGVEKNTSAGRRTNIHPQELCWWIEHPQINGHGPNSVHL